MKKSSFSWDLTIFKSRESFSPFLLISWDWSRVVQTPTPPREVLPISWDLQTKNINRHYFHTEFWRNQPPRGISPFSNPTRVSPHFSPSRGIHQELSRPHPLHEKFSSSRGIYRLKSIMWTFLQCERNQISHVIILFQIKSSRNFQDPTPSTRCSPHLVGITDLKE